MHAASSGRILLTVLALTILAAPMVPTEVRAQRETSIGGQIGRTVQDLIAAPSPVPARGEAATTARIVYTRVDNNISSIWIMNLDGSEQRKLVDHASDPTWSPDGSRVVFFGYDAAPLGRGIYQIRADGTGIEVIWNEGTAQYLDWAPSGPYVAMHALHSIVVFDGRAGKWTTISKGEQPSFSPDSRQIVAKSCDGGDCGLFVMNRDGSGRRRVTMSADDAMPAWSPTGRRIAYATQRDGNWDLYSMNVDGSDPIRLTDDPGTDGTPAWLPDGSGIVFRSTRGGVWGIWIMNADGSDQRKIIDAPAADDWGRSRLDVR
jgi:TolB protein